MTKGTMTKVKSRGNDAEVAVNRENVDMRRLANLGKTIELSFGEVTVREPTLEEVLVLLSDFSSLVEVLKQESNFLELAKSPEIMAAIKKVAAALTKTDKDKFTDLIFSDWVALVVAVKEVVDWEKLSELFTQLDLINLIKNQVQQKP